MHTDVLVKSKQLMIMEWLVSLFQLLGIKSDDHI